MPRVAKVGNKLVTVIEEDVTAVTVEHADGTRAEVKPEEVEPVSWPKKLNVP